MTQPTNTYDTYDNIGIREELTDVIYNIAPTDTPFMSNAPTGGASNTLHEWQTDDLEAVTDNKVVEGDDATLDASVATVRLGNYTQISDKTAVVAGTVESVNRAGREGEMAYQVMKKTKELKRDMENALVGLNNARVAGNATTPRELASFSSWIATNTSFGTNGVDPTGDGTDARTDGTQRAFTEALLTDVIDQIWNEGGDPNIIMCGSFNKRKITGFAGNADEVKHDNTDKKIINAVSMYVSDYGELKIVPNRFVRSRDCLVYQQDMFAVHFLRQFRTQDLAVTGDSRKKQILTEYTLVARNEKSSGIVADLTTS